MTWRVCPECGREYPGTAGWCSKRCYMRAWRKRHPKYDMRLGRGGHLYRVKRRGQKVG